MSLILLSIVDLHPVENSATVASNVSRRLLRHLNAVLENHSQAAVGIAGLAAAATGYGDAVPLVNLAGQVGASALLASYSRDDEREADALGMEYMSRAGYNPDGMVRLMEMLRGESKEQPGLLQTMFSTHPMSDERYATARREAEGRYAGQRGKPLARERYMDSTARLRARSSRRPRR
jgi:predicted Zn-dependent protease